MRRLIKSLLYGMTYSLTLMFLHRKPNSTYAYSEITASEKYIINNHVTNIFSDKVYENTETHLFGYIKNSGEILDKLNVNN
jgi:hypothetical protein